VSFVLVEFLCSGCGERYESLEDRPAPARVAHLACGQEAELVISAPKPATQWGTAVRGKSDPPPSQRSVDTRGLGDGMSLNDWRKQRARMWRDNDRAKRREAMG
jgi:hypothetical protein